MKGISQTETPIFVLVYVLCHKGDYFLDFFQLNITSGEPLAGIK